MDIFAFHVSKHCSLLGSCTIRSMYRTYTVCRVAHHMVIKNTHYLYLDYIDCSYTFSWFLFAAYAIMLYVLKLSLFFSLLMWELNWLGAVRFPGHWFPTHRRNRFFPDKASQNYFRCWPQLCCDALCGRPQRSWLFSDDDRAMQYGTCSKFRGGILSVRGENLKSFILQIFYIQYEYFLNLRKNFAVTQNCWNI